MRQFGVVFNSVTETCFNKCVYSMTLKQLNDEEVVILTCSKHITIAPEQVEQVEQKMRAKLASLNHCAVPFLICAVRIYHAY